MQGAVQVHKGTRWVCARPCMGVTSCLGPPGTMGYSMRPAISHGPISPHALPGSSCPDHPQEEFHCEFCPVGGKYPIIFTSSFWGSSFSKTYLSEINQTVGHLHVVPLKSPLQHSIFGQSPYLPVPPSSGQRMRECCLSHRTSEPGMAPCSGSAEQINPAGPSTPWQLNIAHPKTSTSVLPIAHAFFWKRTSQ